MGSRVLVLPVLQELEELLRSPLLKETHERTPHSLHLVTGDLRDLAITVDEAASDLLELEIPSDFGVYEDLGELARRDDELGDEIYGVVAVAAELGRWGLLIPELAIKLGWGIARSDQTKRCDYARRAPTWVKFRLAESPP